MKAIIEENMICICGWIGSVYKCEPDDDGDLGCPECGEIVKIDKTIREN